MKRFLAAAATSAVLTAGALVAAAPANAAPAPAPAAASATRSLTQSVTGTTSSGSTFTGTLSNINVVNQNGVATIVGQLTGTLTSATGTNLGTVTALPVSLPVLGGSGTCQILHLDLGPLDLNLLGLAVHLNEVVLDITAQSGPGNLLGNLLCGVAHLLDSNGTAGLTNLLNRLLGSL
jgi:hypothetical protein